MQDKDGEQRHEDRNLEYEVSSQDGARVPHSVDLTMPTEISKSPTSTAVDETFRESASQKDDDGCEQILSRDASNPRYRTTAKSGAMPVLGYPRT